MSNIKQIRSDIATSNMELDQIIEEQNQLKVAMQGTTRKEMILLISMKQNELVIYDNLKTALLYRDVVKTTYYLKLVQNLMFEVRIHIDSLHSNFQATMIEYSQYYTMMPA